MRHNQLPLMLCSAPYGRTDPTFAIIMAAELAAYPVDLNITVVGAGRMGVAIGGELARRGAQVLEFPPPPP